MKAQLKAKAKVSSSRASTRAARSSRRAAVLDAVRAAPATDDELRLVLADAFEEDGEIDRAELVRLQIAVARGNADAATIARAKALQVDRDKALAAYALRWVSDRGLVWRVEARADDWIAYGATLFEAEPITSIVVHAPRDDIDEDVDVLANLANQRWLEYVHALEIAPY